MMPITTSDQDISQNIGNDDENKEKTSSESDSHMDNCEECDAEFKSKSGLLLHTRSKHEGIVYSCKQFEYKSAYQSHLKDSPTI